MQLLGCRCCESEHVSCCRFVWEGRDDVRLWESQLSAFPVSVVGQHIRLDHECNVYAVVTKFAYKYLSTHGGPLETGKLTRVMAGAPKTLFFASLLGVKHEKLKQGRGGDARKAQAPREI
jgi:hypothetical protein